MIRFYYILLLNVLIAAGNKETIIPIAEENNKWVKYFEETKPETHTYISSLELYDENMVIFSNYTFENDIQLSQSFEHVVIDNESNIWSPIHFIGLVRFKE